MRYRANTRLKGAPKHLATDPYLEESILQRAKYLLKQRSDRSWYDLSSSLQRALLAVAETQLKEEQDAFVADLADIGLA